MTIQFTDDDFKDVKDVGFNEADFAESPNVKQKPQRPKMSLKDVVGTTAVLGPTSAAGGTRLEEAIESGADTLPVLGHLLGSQVGGFPGAVTGTTLGVTGKQLVEKLSGKREMNPEEIRNETLITAAVETVFRLPAGALFKKARASRELQEGLGVYLRNMKGTLSEMSKKNPALRIAGEKAVGMIDDATRNISDTTGQVGTLLRRWRKIFANTPEVNMQQLMEFEGLLGEAAKFSKSVGGEVVQQHIKKPLLNIAVKQLRHTISKTVDDFARMAGLKDFAKVSKTVGKLIKAAEKKPQGRLATLMEGGALSLAVQGVTGNPVLSYLTTPALFFATEPSVQNALFKIIERSGLGKAATLGLAEFLRESGVGKAATESVKKIGRKK